MFLKVCKKKKKEKKRRKKSSSNIYAYLFIHLLLFFLFSQNTRFGQIFHRCGSVKLFSMMLVLAHTSFIYKYTENPSSTFSMIFVLQQVGKRTTATQNHNKTKINRNKRTKQ